MHRPTCEQVEDKDSMSRNAVVRRGRKQRAGQADHVETAFHGHVPVQTIQFQLYHIYTSISTQAVHVIESTNLDVVIENAAGLTGLRAEDGVLIATEKIYILTIESLPILSGRFFLVLFLES